MTRPDNLPSERAFGLLFAAASVVGAVLAYYHRAPLAHIEYWLAGAAVLAAVSLTVPVVLRPFNIAWYWLGYGLGLVMRPIVLGILFFLIIAPTAMLLRAAGRDELRLRKQRAESYWIPRGPTSPSAESFRNQF